MNIPDIAKHSKVGCFQFPLTIHGKKEKAVKNEKQAFLNRLTTIADANLTNEQLNRKVWYDVYPKVLKDHVHTCNRVTGYIL